MEEMLAGIRIDLGFLDGGLTDEQCNWLVALRKALEAEGIITEGADPSLLRDLAHKMQRAAVESAYRTEQALLGNPHVSRDSLFKDLHADSILPSRAKESRTIGDLCREYMAYNKSRVEKGKLARSTIPKIEMRCRIMEDFFGKGKPLASLNREDAARLVDFLPTLPNNAAKRYRGLSLVAAAERESKLEVKRLIHSETADDYLTGLSAMLTYATELEWINDNPLKARIVRERLPRVLKRDRQTLTPDEMAKVFSSPEFTDQRNGKLAARYWVPLLCLFHGTRANEVAAIHVADVKEDAGIAYLDLREREGRD